MKKNFLFKFLKLTLTIQKKILRINNSRFISFFNVINQNLKFSNKLHFSEDNKFSLKCLSEIRANIKCYFEANLFV